MVDGMGCVKLIVTEQYPKEVIAITEREFAEIYPALDFSAVSPYINLLLENFIPWRALCFCISSVP